MKKNDKRIDRVYSFFNAIRGNNTPNECQITKSKMSLQQIIEF